MGKVAQFVSLRRGAKNCRIIHELLIVILAPILPDFTVYMTALMSTAKPTRRLGAGGRYSQGGKIKFTFSCFLNAAASDMKVVNSTADKAVTFGLLCLGSDKNSNNITETVARLSLNSTLYQTQPKFQLELN